MYNSRHRTQPSRKRKGARPLDSAVPLEDVAVYCGVLRSYLSSCNHADKDLLLGHLRARNFKALLAWTEQCGSPQQYGSSALYFADAQLVALVKKFPFTSAEVPGIDPEATALKKFMAAEHKMKWVNRKVRAKRRCRIDTNMPFWDHARSYISRVIGVTPNLPRLLTRCDFTAGASKGVHGNATNFARKILAERWSCTPSALPYAMTALWLNPHTRDCILPGAIKCLDPGEFRSLVRQRVEFTSCNNISFVPKTAKTHRAIAVEPLLNGFVQKGVEEELKFLLRTKANLDLTNQTPNQVLAYAGSLPIAVDPYCTIDLSSASDSLATEVVKELVPAEWFEFLSEIRSPAGSIHGTSFSYEKFCSMGNGFCFPIQTLIFASVCAAALHECGVNPSRFSVYGDDIVVPQSVALLVIERLKDIGFSTNRDKTFITGPFRESCGRDWYEGQDVRPVTLSKRFKDLRSLCAFHNGTLRSVRTEILFEEVRAYLRQFRPELLRPGLEPGDTAFSVPLDSAMTSPWVWRNRDTQSWSWREVLSPPMADNVPLPLSVRANVQMYAVLQGAMPDKMFTLRYETKPRLARVSRQYIDRRFSDFEVEGDVVLSRLLVHTRTGY